MGFSQSYTLSCHLANELVEDSTGRKYFLTGRCHIFDKPGSSINLSRIEKICSSGEFEHLFFTHEPVSNVRERRALKRLTKKLYVQVTSYEGTPDGIPRSFTRLMRPTKLSLLPISNN